MAKSDASVVLSAADSAWLHMEDPTNLMMITGLFLFGEPISVDRLRQVAADRLLQIPRFASRVEQGRLGRARWVRQDAVDLEHHVQVLEAAPSDEADLMVLVSDLMSTPLERDVPLWQFHLVPNYQGGSAMICRLHHAIADGIALMKVLISLTESGPAAQPAGPTVISELAPEELLEAPNRRTATLLQQGRSARVKPGEVVDVVVKHLAAATKLGRMLLGHEPNLLKGPLGIPKRAAVSAPIHLDTVKQVRRHFGCTVNDVLMTALTGGVRRYLLRRKARLKPGMSVRAVVPVDLRRAGDDGLGNRFGLVFLSLPVGTEDPEERIRTIQRRMDRLKNSPQAVVVFGLLSAVGAAVPAEFQQHVVELFGSKATSVVTNVPGPKKTLYLGGKPISSLMFWVPQSGRLGMGMSILSYAGQVRVGVACDAGLIPDPQQLAGDFEESFQELVRLTGDLA